jgi:serine/threonine protein kinase
VEKPILLQDVQTLVVKTESPDHISTWKQFCKTQMSLFHTLSIFR